MFDTETVQVKWVDTKDRIHSLTYTVKGGSYSEVLITTKEQEALKEILNRTLLTLMEKTKRPPKLLTN